jgi:hypothetical protein
VNAAGRYASGLYRVTDTDGDDRLDRVELLRAFEGDGEHGPHGVVLDADGSLLVVAGNYTGLPEPLERCRRPRNWAEDVLLPPLDDPNGHAVGIHAPGGWVARTDAEGRRWELVAAGFRNPYDLALSSDGELFTYDSDMEWDVGMPWYKPTRVLHVVSGAEFGWRAGSGNWPADSFDALPAVDELALGSPTGLVFGSATRFPAPWKDALFAGDWAYGRLFAVFLEPDGASYRGHHEVFASGQPFAVTDVVAGGDGALYVTVGGRKSQSGLYRIAWVGGTESASHGPPEARAPRPRASCGTGSSASTASARARRSCPRWRTSAIPTASCATPRASRWSPRTRRCGRRRCWPRAMRGGCSRACSRWCTPSPRPTRTRSSSAPWASSPARPSAPSGWTRCACWSSRSCASRCATPSARACAPCSIRPTRAATRASTARCSGYW